MEATFHKDSALRQQFKTGKTITWIADQSGLPMGPLEDWFRELGIRRLIMVPLIVGQSSFGVLGIGEAELAVDSFTAQAGLVERIAFDLASLAEGAILSEQQIALVALEERNRLARDLHDSVTQVLFTATLLTEILPQIWRRDPQQGMETLEKLRLLTRGALAEMRTMLIELRPSSVVNTPLSQLLAQLTEAITCRSGLPFQLVIENIPLLPEEAQMNFYRIAQEALNNVVKHGQAGIWWLR
jgi:signal transduction histidine kinase